MRHTTQQHLQPTFSHRTDHVVQRLLAGYTVHSHVCDLTVGPVRLGVWRLDDGPCWFIDVDVFDIAFRFVRAELRRVGDQEAA